MNANGIKDYLKGNFDKIEMLLDSIGCHKIWESSRGNEVRCAPPNGSNKTSISVKMETLASSHFSEKGLDKDITDIISLVGYFKKYDFKDSMRYITSIFGLSKGNFIHKEDQLSHLKKHRRRKAIKLSEIDEEKFPKTMLNNYVQMPHYELFKEGIMPQIQEQFNICYDDRLDRILFPHFSFDNKDEIVGISGRTLASKQMMDEFDIPKYWNYIKGYKKTHNLYGFSHNIENIKKAKQLIIFESEKSVLKDSTQLGGCGIGVAVGNHSLSDIQVKIIIQLTPPDTEIIIAFDKDVMTMEDESGKHIGIEYLENICKKLSSYRKVSYIYDNYDVLNEKDSPNDKGIKIWQHLLKYRVKTWESVRKCQD